MKVLKILVRLKCKQKTRIMNYNIVGYLCYLPILFFVTFLVGKELHKAGKYFVCEMIRDNETFATAVNNSLLVGYYLLNLGYVALMVRGWEEITSLTSLLVVLCDRLGTILVTLGLVHFGNMLVLTLTAGRSATKNLMFNPK